MRDMVSVTFSVCLIVFAALQANVLAHINDYDVNCNDSVPRKPAPVSLTEEEMATFDQTDYKTAETIYEFTVKDTFGQDVSLEKYRGNVVLIVNIASKCGLTKSNYEKLTQLNEKYYERGLRILAFPCNQFGSQMPESNGEDMVCHLRSANANIGEVFAKVNVNGDTAIPLYKFLKHKKDGLFGNAIKWNFTKFLVNKEGVPVERYAPTTSDLDKDIEKLL